MNTYEVERLLNVLYEIKHELSLLGIEEQYLGVSKSLNILNNLNITGYKNINSYLLSDFRKNYDDRKGSSKLDRLFDKACELSRKNFLFDKNN